MVLQTSKRKLTSKQLAKNLKKHLSLKDHEAKTKKRVSESKMVIVKAKDVR